MVLLLKDLETTITTLSNDSSLFWWSEGNGSCDCNRALCFEPELDKELEEKFGPNICYGSKRIVAIGVLGDLEGYTKEQVLELINESYK